MLICIWKVASYDMSHVGHLVDPIVSADFLEAAPFSLVFDLFTYPSILCWLQGRLQLWLLQSLFNGLVDWLTKRVQNWAAQALLNPCNPCNPCGHERKRALYITVACLAGSPFPVATGSMAMAPYFCSSWRFLR